MMKHSEDDRFGQDPLSLDEANAESLFSGAFIPTTSTSAYVPVAELFGRVRQAVSDDMTDVDAVRASQQLLAAAGVAGSASQRRRGYARSSAKALAVASGVVLFTSGAAAAATGSLPEPAQRTVARVMATVGLDLPDGHDRESTQDGDRNGRVGGVTASSSESSRGGSNGETNGESNGAGASDDAGKARQEGTVPGNEACAEARLVDGVNGCSDLARDAAPGQERRDEVPNAATKNTGPSVTAPGQVNKAGATPSSAVPPSASPSTGPPKPPPSAAGVGGGVKGPSPRANESGAPAK